VVPGPVDAIRVQFTGALSQDAQHKPSTHGLNDPAFASHNVQVLVAKNEVNVRGVQYVPGDVVMEAPDTLRFTPLRNTRIVNRTGRWPTGRANFVLFLRGTPLSTAGDGPLADQAGQALDGEPIGPAGGVISGDGNAGGDFTARFAVDTQ
jgi:hypothetical protein